MTKTTLISILPAMNISARLVISGVITAQKEYVLSTQPVIIGRENANDLVLKDPEVSRRHARITYQAGRYYVEDLGSTNGTFLNEQPVQTQVPLNHGDVIRLGESIRLTYYGLAAEDAGETFILEDPQDRIETPPLQRPVGGYQQPQQYQPPAQQQQPAFGGPAYSQPQPFQRQSQEFGPPPEPGKERNTTRIVLGCGCLLILLLIACAASLYLLDSFAPDLLYCGVLEPVVKALGVTALICP
ncbi:MAG: FHA domain-containing protein [Candidatus Promineifilaceae bacterium]